MKKGLMQQQIGLDPESGKITGDPFWTRFAWILERKFPKEFGNPTKKNPEEQEEEGQSQLKAAFAEELIPESKKIKE